MKLLYTVDVCLILMLGLPACSLATTDFIPTENIRVQFYGSGGDLDENQKYIIDPKRVLFAVQFNIPGIQHIEISDDSSRSIVCKNTALKTSPSVIGSYTVEPAQEIRQLNFAMALPCAAYHKKLDLLIKVKTTQGNFSHRQHIPVLIRTGDGA